ncbi:hypothetical protein YC2023_051997 [Brassica napus]
MNCLPASDMAWAEGVLSILVLGSDYYNQLAADQIYQYRYLLSNILQSFWIIVVKSWERASVGLGKRDKSPNEQSTWLNLRRRGRSVEERFCSDMAGKIRCDHRGELEEKKTLKFPSLKGRRNTQTL